MKDILELIDGTMRVLQVHVNKLKEVNDLDVNPMDKAAILGMVAGTINVIRIHLAIKPACTDYVNDECIAMLNDLPLDQREVFTNIGDFSSVGFSSRESH